MSFHRPSEDKKEEIEQLEEFEQDIVEDDPSGEGYGTDISRTAWELNKEKGANYKQNKMEELVFNYAEHFRDFYEEDPENVLDYLERFDGNINSAIASLEE
jgi:hypothetical protein